MGYPRPQRVFAAREIAIGVCLLIQLLIIRLAKDRDVGYRIYKSALGPNGSFLTEAAKNVFVYRLFDVPRRVRNGEFPLKTTRQAMGGCYYIPEVIAADNKAPAVTDSQNHTSLHWIIPR
jgi:hypothetical protein